MSCFFRSHGSFDSFGSLILDDSHHGYVDESVLLWTMRLEKCLVLYVLDVGLMIGVSRALMV